MDPDFDPSPELFSVNDFIDDQPEVPSDLDDLPYPYFFAGASDCASASNGSLGGVRARNNACPILQDEGLTTRPTTDREQVINQLLAPLDSLDQTGETANKNFVDTFCLDSTIERRAIPMCTSGLKGDVYPNALEGVTLRNCELCKTDKLIRGNNERLIIPYSGFEQHAYLYIPQKYNVLRRI